MRKLYVGTVVLASLFATQVAYAHPGHDHAEKSEVTDVIDATIENATKTTERAVDTASLDRKTDVAKKLKQRVISQHEQIASKKTEILETIKQSNATEPNQKLEGRRLAQCHNRKVAIDRLIGSSSITNKKLLSKIQRVEEGVRAYYLTNKLSNDEYADTAQIVDEAEAFAVASIDVGASQKFECDQVNAADTSATIKMSHLQRTIALKAYRDAVIRLVSIAKSSTKETN